MLSKKVLRPQSAAKTVRNAFQKRTQAVHRTHLWTATTYAQNRQRNSGSGCWKYLVACCVARKRRLEWPSTRDRCSCVRFSRIKLLSSPGLHRSRARQSKRPAWYLLVIRLKTASSKRYTSKFASWLQRPSAQGPDIRSSNYISQ